MVLKTNTAVTNQSTVFVVLYRAAGISMYAERKQEGLYKKPPGSVRGMLETAAISQTKSVL